MSQYDEPWRIERSNLPIEGIYGSHSCAEIYTVEENIVIGVIGDDEVGGVYLERIVACINACANLEDPEKELSMLAVELSTLVTLIEQAYPKQAKTWLSQVKRFLEHRKDHGAGR